MLQKFYARLFTIIFLPLVACQLPGGQAAPPTSQVLASIDLPFITLVKDDFAYLCSQNDCNYGAVTSDLDLMVAINATKAQEIAYHLNPNQTSLQLPQIEKVDFAKDIVIVAYFGRASSGGYEITIEAIHQNGNLIEILISTVEPGGGDAVETRPIHIVTIDKENLTSRGDLTFRLWKNGEMVLERQYYVPSIELPFVTLDKIIFSRSASNMDLMVATNITETQTIANQLSPDQPVTQLPALEEIDFEQSIMIVAYFGQAPTNNYEITIEKIYQTESKVDVFVQTVEPGGGDTVVTYPIHIVKVDKANLSNRGELTFRLWKNNKIVVQRDHFVP